MQISSRKGPHQPPRCKGDIDHGVNPGLAEITHRAQDAHDLGGFLLGPRLVPFYPSHPKVSDHCTLSTIQVFTFDLLVTTVGG